MSLVYCLYMVISNGWSVEPDFEQFLEILRKASLVLFFLLITACVFFNRWNRLDVLFKYLCLTSGVMAVASIVWFGFIHYDFLTSLEYRLVGFGTLGGAIAAANCYAVTILIGFCYFLAKEEMAIGEKVKYSLAVFAGMMFVILTQSRGPLLALAGALTLSAVLIRTKLILWVIGCISLGFAVVTASGFFEFSALLSRADSYRLAIWQQSWEIFLKQPWFGYGLGGDRPDIIVLESIPIAHPHNLFLSNMVDGGVFALLLIVSLLSLSAYWATRFFLDSKNITLLALTVFSVLANLTDGKLLIVSPNYQWLFFWLPIGITAAYELRNSRQTLVSSETGT